ncbi:hypothetical protein BGZ60DRAFT_341422, partial [Tricladium varicosporioides]
LNSEPKTATSTKSISRPASPSFGTASTSTLPKEDKDDFTLVGAPSTESARDRGSYANGVADKTPEVTEGRRSKKGKKQKNAEKEAVEKDKEELKPEVLVPAPLPTVNFWQQRREEAAKKPAPTAVTAYTGPTEPIISNDAPRSPDSKRRSKLAAEENEKPTSASQNGVSKDSGNTKSQKKNSDVSAKLKEDPSSTKRVGPRGSRTGEKEEKLTATQLPPPVGDAMSWPTPETAIEEEKRKLLEKLEKEDKDDTTSNKPRPKEKWVPVPYVPSVAFNTPLPTRGGRGRGGARGGRTEANGRSTHTTNAGSGEKGQNTTATTALPSADSDRRTSRGEAPRAASLPPNSTKRQSSDPSGSRDQRKPTVPATSEKSKGNTNKGEHGAVSDLRQNTSADSTAEAILEQQNARGEQSRNFKADHNQGVPHDAQSNPRSAVDRRSEPNLRGFEQAKDSSSLKDPNHHSRERADGRPERGRGGFRGRGNHNFQNGQQHPGHIFTNGHGPQAPNGYPLRQNSGPYSPPLQQPPFNSQFPIPSSRGGRGGSRSQSIPNNNMYGRYPGSQHMPPLQTSGAMYDYQPMQSMSAVPFNPYIDHISVLNMVTMQLEYYFSIDNLCKDVFLRKHMDSQGFVFLTFIAGFKRIQALTQEFELLRYACQESEIIDLVRGEDGIDRLRRKEGWEKWVLATEDRDESVRNAGPSYHHRPQRAQQGGSMILPGGHSMSPPPFSPNGIDSQFRHFSNGGPVAQPVNGNGNGNGYHPETPLSAAVPDFSPSVMTTNSTVDPLEAETTFSDEEVANLTLVFNVPKSSDGTKPKVPYHNASSRTFSNGSIDGRSIAEEIHDENRQGRSLTNGSHGSETSPDTLRLIPESLARHYVELVKSEDPTSRPAFERLRAAWRNGALDMKSRKKIDKLVDQDLREELERAPKQKSDLS